MILASQSPRRRELLSDAGFELEIAPADIDESRREHETPVQLVERLAAEKADEACRTLDHAPSDGLLVAADTIVWMGDEALGKPVDASDAMTMLGELSGRTHHVSTGVCALSLTADGACAARACFVETTDVVFWPLTEAEIAAYVATGEPLDKAGAYGIQGAGRLLVEKIDGDYSNVVGLPVARLVREVTRLMGDEKDYVTEAIRIGGPLA